jgi:branched-chain amino acid transport system permease protein
MNGYLFHLCIYFCIYATVGLSLSVSVGYGGYLVLAQAGFFAIGCYSYALGATVWGLGLGTCLVIAVSVGVVMSLALSLPSWRLKGDFFVMASLAVQSVVQSLLNNWYSDGHPVGSWANLTNGPSGIPNIPRPAMFGIKFDTNGSVALLTLFILLLSLVYLQFVLRGPWGKALLARRDDELATRGLGKNVKLLKLQIFAVSCGIVAAAGVGYASYLGYVDPTLASLDHSVLMLSMVIVGGTGSLRGPLVGALLLIGIPEVLRFAHFPDQTASSIRLMAYGVLLVGMMHLRPQGLLGRFRVS